jgi:hypothetical protein
MHNWKKRLEKDGRRSYPIWRCMKCGSRVRRNPGNALPHNDLKMDEDGFPTLPHADPNTGMNCDEIIILNLMICLETNEGMMVIEMMEKIHTMNKEWAVWMYPLYPNSADGRWYPPHVPMKDRGTKDWAEKEALRLNNMQGGLWPAWAYQPKPYDSKVGANI